jgi:hypothetical protein
MLALAHYEAGVCECGFHESLTKDKSNVFRPGHRVCAVCGGFAQYGRMLAEADEAAAKFNPNKPVREPRPSDGRHVYMSIAPEGRTH